MNAILEFLYLLVGAIGLGLILGTVLGQGIFMVILYSRDRRWRRR